MAALMLSEVGQRNEIRWVLRAGLTLFYGVIGICEDEWPERMLVVLSHSATDALWVIE